MLDRSPGATSIALALPSLLALAMAASAQEHRHRDAAGAARHEHHTTGQPALLPGLGDWGHPITTRLTKAQQFFDQGLRLTYAFKHDEAERSFREAARLDSTCAMCWWGVAYAAGPNINLPMTEDGEKRAFAAIRQAQRLASGASEREQAYVNAMARRFGDPAGANRAARDSAYATAMRDVASRWPDDIDAQVLYGDALLNLRPWNQWTVDGQPQPGTLEVIATLERALAKSPGTA